MFCFFEGYRVSECRNAYAYFVSNTGYRFITKKKTCYAVSVPKPEGGYIRRSVGFALNLSQASALLVIMRRIKPASVLTFVVPIAQ